MIEMFPHLTFSVVLLATFSTIFGQLAEGQNCRTPNDEIAKCINLRSCPTLYEPLFKNSSQEISSFVKESKCGSAGQIPLVCCGSVNYHIEKIPVTGYLGHRLLPENCGISEGTTKLIGGEKADLGEFPWMALLGHVADDGSPFFFCVGSLISSRYVLTVAHCSSRQQITTVRLGEYDKSKDRDCITTSGKTKCGDPVVDVEVEKFIRHAGYNNSTEDNNDIALVKLNRKISFSRFIKPICLPNKDAPVQPTSTLIVAGWGPTETDIMLKLLLKVKDNNICSRYLDRQVLIHANQFCASGDNDWSCQGDSGGPAMRIFLNTLPQRWLLEGVLSYGIACGGVSHPAVYTKVSKHIDWILENMQ